MTGRGRAPLPARFAACVAACLLMGTALALMGALVVRAVRLLIEGLAWMVSLAWGGGVSL